MKTAILAIILTLATVAAAKDKSEAIVTTDKFTGATQVVSVPFVIAQIGGTAFLMSVYFGHFSDNHPNEVFMTVRCVADTWRFPSGADVHLLIDGEALDLGHFEQRRGNVGEVLGDVKTIEKLGEFIPRATFERMAKAHKLEFEVGTFEGKADDKGLAKMQSFSGAVATAEAGKR